MDLLNKIGDVLTSTGQEVAKKAKDVADIANLNLQLKNANEELEKLYALIGKKYFLENRDKSKDELGIAYAESMRIISRQIDKVESIMQELAKAKGAVKCPQCQKDVQKESKFCPYCGERLEEVLYGEVVEDIFEDN